MLFFCCPDMITPQAHALFLPAASFIQTHRNSSVCYLVCLLNSMYSKYGILWLAPLPVPEVETMNQWRSVHLRESTGTAETQWEWRGVKLHSLKLGRHCMSLLIAVIAHHLVLNHLTFESSVLHGQSLQFLYLHCTYGLINKPQCGRSHRVFKQYRRTALSFVISKKVLF